MAFEEFKIDSLPDRIFRVSKISPVDLLAITQTINFNKFSTNQELIGFCLEHAEVLIGEKWVPVKMKDRDIYQPMGIENDYIALNEIYLWMMENVIGKTFTKSSESTEETR